MLRQFSWAVVLAGSITALLVAFGISTQSIVVGSQEGNWTYPYIRPLTGQPIVIFAMTSAIALVLCAVPRRVARRHEWLMVLVWLAAGFWIQSLLRSVTPFSFSQIFASDTANSFFNPTAGHSAAALLSDFDRLRDSLPLHARSNMPGKLLVAAAIRHISSDPAVLAWVIVAMSNLGGVLLYLLVRDLFSNRRVALYSLALYLCVPAKLFFLPLFNTLTPTVALVSACLLVRWLRTRGAAFAGCFGASVYGLVLYEPLVLALGLLFAAWIAAVLRRPDVRWRPLVWQSGIAVLGFGVTYGLFLAAFHFDLFGTLRQTAGNAAAFNAEANRPYGVWVWRDLLEFALGVGACQAVIFCAALGLVIARGMVSTRRLWDPLAILCLGLAAILLVIDLIGMNRGEVTRLWIFLACLFQVPVAYICARNKGSIALMVVLCATLLQCALGTAMIGFIVP